MGRKAILTALFAAGWLAACSDSTEPDPVVGDPVSGEADSLRPPDPGLDFLLGCTTDRAIDNNLAVNLPPDAIRAFLDPVFVPLDSVKTLGSSDRVFGVEIDGRVFGFPRRLMNLHEVATFTVVDDDGVELMRTSATWCPLTFSFVEWRSDWSEGSRPVDASFGVSGLLLDNNLVLFDRETNTTWAQILGVGLKGPRAGECLTMGRNTSDLEFGQFRELYPRAQILADFNTPYGEGAIGDGEEYYQIYWDDVEVVGAGEIAHPDSRMKPKDVVLGVHGESGVAAVKMSLTYVMHGKIGGTSMVVFHHPPTGSYFAFHNQVKGTSRQFDLFDQSGTTPLYQDETGTTWRFDGVAVEGPDAGERLAQVPAFRVFWFAWATLHPGTELIR